MKQKVKPLSACNRSPAQRTRTQRATFTLLAPKSPAYRKSLRQAIRNSGRQNHQRNEGRCQKERKEQAGTVILEKSKPSGDLDWNFLTLTADMTLPVR